MSQLLSQFKIGDLTLANRVVMAPLTRGRAGTSRIPNDIMTIHYQQRATAGLIISEATAVSAQGYGWYGAPGMYTEEQSEGWKPITEAVHSAGGKIFMQMWHIGRQGHPSFSEANELVAPTASVVPGNHYVRDAQGDKVPCVPARALLIEEIPLIVEDYKKSAILAKSAGFDGVEIHACNGCLIDLFLQSSDNHRTDHYGGSVENRFRFLKEIVDTVTEVFPSNRVGVRISPNGIDGTDGSADNDVQFEYVARQLKPYGLAYLHVMDGEGLGYHGKCRVLNLFDFKTWFGGPLMGNITYTKESAEGAIRSGTADLIAFGRAYMSNPDLVERFANNLPLNPDVDRLYWYGPHNGAKGYTDFPFYCETVTSANIVN